MVLACVSWYDGLLASEILVFSLAGWIFITGDDASRLVGFEIDGWMRTGCFGLGAVVLAFLQNEIPATIVIAAFMSAFVIAVKKNHRSVQQATLPAAQDNRFTRKEQKRKDLKDLKAAQRESSAEAKRGGTGGPPPAKAASDVAPAPAEGAPDVQDAPAVRARKPWWSWGVPHPPPVDSHVC